MAIGVLRDVVNTNSILLLKTSKTVPRGSMQTALNLLAKERFSSERSTFGFSGFIFSRVFSSVAFD